MTETAKFVRGHGNECTPLSMSLSRLHILCEHPPPPQQSLCPPKSHRQMPGPPYCTNDPANYVFKVFGSCENSFRLVVEGGGAVGEWRVHGGCGGGPRSHGYHDCPGFYVNTGLGQQGLIEESW